MRKDLLSMSKDELWEEAKFCQQEIQRSKVDIETFRMLITACESKIKNFEEMLESIKVFLDDKDGTLKDDNN